MGAAVNCGQDVFGKLFENFGEDFLRLILAEKAKTFVRDKFTDFTNHFNTIFDDYTNKTTEIVDDKSQELANVLESAKNTVDSTLPGGISTIERVKGQSINEISGYNKLQSSIDSIKDSTLEKVEGRRKEVMNQLNMKERLVVENIEKQKPQIAAYDQLPDFAKREILKKSEKEFKEQIANHKVKIQGEAEKHFNPEMLTSFLQQVNPENALRNIVGSAFPTFTQKISGGGVGGGLNGAIGGISKFF